MEKGAHYYSHLKENELYEEFKTRETGLTSIDAETRIEKYGHNSLAKVKKYNPILQILSRLKSPLLLILLIAAGLSASFGETLNAIIILVMISLGVILDFVQEFHAGKAVDKLMETVKTKVIVLRD
jgi:Mg2+-importing ATPase